MALNIPMPGLPGEALLRGLETGSGLFSRYMQPILQREAQAQQAQQFGANLGQRQSEQSQAQENFLKELEMRKQQMAQAHAFDSIKKQLMQQQLLRLRHSNDPMYEFQQFQNMAKMFGSGNEDQTNNGQPTNPFGEGQGVFNPETMQQPPPQPQNRMNLEAFKQNPILRGFFKHKFGFDPLAQNPLSPQEKQQNELDLYAQKLALKKEAQNPKPGDVPITTAMKTKLQGVVNGVDNSLPVIEELINDYKKLPTGSETFNPSAYASYNAKANSIIEPLINAFGLNITDATKQMMHDQVFRKTNEPLEKYRNRLVDLGKEIIRRRDDSFNTLNTGIINPKKTFTSEYFENLKNETKELNGKKYKKINGEWHEI